MALYFRIKENGATVFRLTESVSAQRLEMTPVADLNVRNGAVKPRATALSAEETEEIETWIAARCDVLARREAAIPEEAIEALNAAAHWISSKPDPTTADAASDALLLAMHDLRSAIVRFKARRIDT